MNNKPSKGTTSLTGHITINFVKNGSYATVNEFQKTLDKNIIALRNSMISYYQDFLGESVELMN